MMQSKNTVNSMSRRAAMLSIAGTAGILMTGYGNAAAYIGGTSRSFLSATPGTTLVTYRGHAATVISVVWSPDSQLVASSDQNGSIQVWNAATGKRKFVCKNSPSGQTLLSWSSNGQYIAGANGGSVFVWNATHGSLMTHYTAQSAGITALAFSPDSQRIATSSYDRTVQIWQATTGALLLTYNGQNVASGAPVVSLSWSPDGTQIVSSSSLRGGSGEVTNSVKIWDTTTGNDVFVYDATNSSNVVAWAPSGSLIASEKYVASDDTVQLWSPTNGQGSSLSINDPYVGVQKISWSPSSKYVALALGSYQALVPTSRVEVRSATGTSFMLDYTGHQPNVRDVAWSPDGTRIASSSDDKTVQIWQAPQ